MSREGITKSHPSHTTIQALTWEPWSPPCPGEILVRVQACGLNRLDHALSTGAVSQLSAHGAPYICGMDAAGTVIAVGDGDARFAVGDEVFGHFPAASWAWVQAPCVRTTADGPHVEHRPEGLDPLAAVALAEAGLTAKTILRAAELKPGQTALVIGATSRAGPVLVPLLAEAGTRVIAVATPGDDDVRSLGVADTIDYTTADPVADALASHPDVDLLVDLVSFDEPYFITAAASHGTIVTTFPVADEPGIPRIEITAEPGDLAALAQYARDWRQPVETSYVYRPETVDPALPARHRRAASTRPRRLIRAAGSMYRSEFREDHLTADGPVHVDFRRSGNTGRDGGRDRDRPGAHHTSPWLRRVDDVAAADRGIVRHYD